MCYITSLFKMNLGLFFGLPQFDYSLYKLLQQYYGADGITPADLQKLDCYRHAVSIRSILTAGSSKLHHYAKCQEYFSQHTHTRKQAVRNGGSQTADWYTAASPLKHCNKMSHLVTGQLHTFVSSLALVILFRTCLSSLLDNWLWDFWPYFNAEP